MIIAESIEFRMEKCAGVDDGANEFRNSIVLMNGGSAVFDYDSSVPAPFANGHDRSNVLIFIDGPMLTHFD